MLNQAKTIEKLKIIQDPTFKERYLRYYSLPPVLQKKIFATETADKIWEIAEKYKLKTEQIPKLSLAVGLVIIGETAIGNLSDDLSKNCGLIPEQAQKLAQEINEEVFWPIKEDLKKIHKVQIWPGEQEVKPSNIQPIPPPPPLNAEIPKTETPKNIINLKQ